MRWSARTSLSSCLSRPCRSVRLVVFLAALVLCSGLPLLPGYAGEVRVKDLARVQGARDNELFGYGLVMGLNNPGDKNTTVFTVQTITNMLQRMGVQVARDKIDMKNVAAVIVTATLPPFAKAGTNLDVLVSSLGDATSLQGGTLLLTPLQAADGKVYAAAQGPISIGGFSVEAGGTGDRVQKNHPTAGRIPAGAIIERDVPTTVVENQTLTLVLSRPDYTTAGRVAQVVNGALGAGTARAEDAATIRVRVQPDQDLIALIGRLEHLSVQPDRVAKVVVNERTGTVIMGSQVRVSTVAISHGSLTVQIKNDYQASQPNPFGQGRTAIVQNSNVTVKEEKRALSVIEEGASIGDLVQALNALGVTSRDLIAILQAIRQAGALQAELEIL